MGQDGVTRAERGKEIEADTCWLGGGGVENGEVTRWKACLGGRGGSYGGGGSRIRRREVRRRGGGWREGCRASGGREVNRESAGRRREVGGEGRGRGGGGGGGGGEGGGRVTGGVE